MPWVKGLISPGEAILCKRTYTKKSCDTVTLSSAENFNQQLYKKTRYIVHCIPLESYLPHFSSNPASGPASSYPVTYVNQMGIFYSAQCVSARHFLVSNATMNDSYWLSHYPSLLTAAHSVSNLAQLVL